MRFYWLNSVMSAFTLLEVIAGATFLVAAAVSVLLWIRKPAGGARLTVFDQLLDRVHAHRTEFFAGHRLPRGTIQARQELLEETRLRLRREKSFFSERRESSVTGFTRVELLTVLAAIAICVGILFAALLRVKPRAARTGCISNLKEIGLACRIWANDHADQYPMHVSRREGGSKEFVEGPNAFRHFQAMSSELSTPKILLCPEDRGRAVAARSFTTDFNNSKLSYFFGLDVTEPNPRDFVSGDRNITNGFLVRDGTLLLITNQTVGWTDRIHVKAGNIGFADGSADSFANTGLQAALRKSYLPTNRLAIP